jgi:hypothetical protein
VLASGQSNPVGVAVDSQNVYWTNYASGTGDGTVMSVPVGGGPPTTLAAGQNGPAAIAVDASNVYWVNFGDGTVMTIPIGGGSPLTIASGQDHPVGIAVDALGVYWNNFGDCSGPITGAVMSGSKDGSVPPTALVTGLCEPDSTLVAVDKVFYHVLPGGGLGVSISYTLYFSASRSLFSVSPLGGPSTNLGAGGSALAADTSNVYWADEDDDSVGSVTLGGDAGVTLVPGNGANFCVPGKCIPGSLAVDHTGLYWANPDSNSLEWISRAGGSPLALRNGVSAPVTPAGGPTLRAAMAMDATSVYWIAYGSDLRRTPK